jgi:peroxiredoxin
MSTAPDFTLRNLNGESRGLRSILAGGPVVLAFFKIDCPTCQLTLPFLQRIADRGAQRVIAVSQDDREGTLEFHNEFRISLDTVIDEESSRYAVSRAYGVTNVPTLFSVGAEGTIVDSIHGFDKARLDELAGGGLFTDADRVPAYKPG